MEGSAGGVEGSVAGGRRTPGQHRCQGAQGGGVDVERSRIRQSREVGPQEGQILGPQVGDGGKLVEHQDRPAQGRCGRGGCGIGAAVLRPLRRDGTQLGQQFLILGGSTAFSQTHMFHMPKRPASIIS